MKNFKVLFLSMLAASLIITSCSKDDEDPPAGPNLGPTTFNVTPDDVDAFPSSTVEFVYDADTNADSLVSLNVTVGNDASTTETITFIGTSTIFDGIYEWTVPDTATSGDQYTLNFTLIDVDGINEALFETATVNVIGSVLGGQIAGQIWHIAGPASQPGAWDLVNDVQRTVGEDDATKSLINVNMAGDPFTGAWTSGDGSMFAKFDLADYEALSSTADILYKEQLMDIYSQETSTDVVPDPAEGDTYVVLLGDGVTYVLLEIPMDNPDTSQVEGIDPSAGMGNNTGRMTFVYKKSV